jgi:hypothetical protein
MFPKSLNLLGTLHPLSEGYPAAENLVESH